MLVELNENEINWIKEEVFASLGNLYEGSLSSVDGKEGLLEVSPDMFDMFDIPKEVVLMQSLGKKLIKALGE